MQQLHRIGTTFAITLQGNEGLVVTFDVPLNSRNVFNRRYPHLMLSIYPQGYVIKNTDTGLFHYYHYIANGKASLVSIVDRDQNNIRFIQNDEGKPVEIYHSDGIQLALEYSHGFLSKITRVYADKNVLIAQFIQKGDLLISAWSKGNNDHVMQYNREGLMTLLQYADNTKVRYEYDTTERCISMRGSEGFNHWDFEYQDKKQTNAARDANNNIWVFCYNDDDQVIKEYEGV